jgi:hypothetical protein
MFVTFDSQTFRAIVEPSRHLRHPSRHALERVHAAVLKKDIQPLASEGIFALEEITRAERANFLAHRRSTVETVDESAIGNSIALTVSVGPDHSLHPGLSPESRRRFDAAIALGFRFLNIPRFGLVRPRELLDANNYLNCEGDDFNAFTRFGGRFGIISDQIESHHVGFAIAQGIGMRARTRAGYRANWCELLTDPRYLNDNERQEVGAAVSEWCDGDLVASHVAHDLTYICTEDRAGRKQRPSVFNTFNREWLTREHGVQFVSVDELANQLPN